MRRQTTGIRGYVDRASTLFVLLALVFLVIITFTALPEYPASRLSIRVVTGEQLAAAAFFLLLAAVALQLALRIYNPGLEGEVMAKSQDWRMNPMKLFSVVGVIKKKLKEHFASVAAIFMLTLFLWRNTILSLDEPAGADLPGFISDVGFLSKTGGAFQIWQNVHFGAVIHPTFDDMLAILNSFVNDSVLLVKVFMIAIFLLSAFSMYFFTYQFAKSKIASLFSSVVFSLSQVSVAHWTSGMLNHIFAYALIPTVFYAYDRALRDGRFVWVLVFATVTGLNSLIRLDAIVFLLPFIILYGLFNILIPESGTRRRATLKHTLKVTLGGGLLAFCLFSFVLVPILMGVRAEYFQKVVGITLDTVRDGSLELYESFLGMSMGLSYLWWIGRISWSSHAFLTMPEYRASMLILPVLAFSAMLLVKRDRRVLFFILAALVSIFLAKGPHSPLEDAYTWLFYNFPQFNKFTTPNRWLRITDFAYAFLAGITLKAVLEKSKKLRIGIEYQSVSKMVRAQPIFKVLVVLLIIPLLFPVWVVVSPGFLTRHVPESEIEPHLWIAKQPGDFSIFAVPFQADMWTSGPVGGTQGYWTQDFGFRSSSYHGKPVVGLPFFFTTTDDFAVYIHGLIANGGTDNIMKILGSLGVKYLVMQGYPETQYKLPYSSGWQKRFFSEQKGLKQVYAKGNVSVYKNEFYIPRIFGAPNCMTIIGSRDALTLLTHIENFNLGEWCLTYTDPPELLGKESLDKLLSESQMIVFANTEPLDLVMLNIENAIRIRAVDYGIGSDSTKGWISTNQWISMGMLNHYALSTSGRSKVFIPVTVEKQGEYEVWMRVLYGPGIGNLSLAIGGQEIGRLAPSLKCYGFKWTKIGSIPLNPGRYELALINEPSDMGRRADVDEILLVRPEELALANSLTTKMLQNSSARVLQLVEATQMFKWSAYSPEQALQTNPEILADDNQTSVWSAGNSGKGTIGEPILSDDTHQVSTGQNSLKVTVSDGQYETWYLSKIFDPFQDWSYRDFISFDMYGLNSGKPILVWFGEDWDNRFQFRFNEDWSGWKRLVLPLREANIREGNPTLSRIGLLGIQMTENTLGTRYIDRVIIDNYPGAQYDVKQFPFVATNGYLVKNRIKNAMIPLNYTVAKDGRYYISLRVSMGPEYGTIEVIVDNAFVQSTNLYNDQMQMNYITFGPLDLEQGDHNFTIRTRGRIELDQIILYSSGRNCNTTLNDLFNTNGLKPLITYEMINPTKYIAHVKTYQPLYLVFSQAYHPLWRAFVDGKEIESEPVNSFFNSFYISKTGEYDVTIEFVGQRYVFYGGLISMVSAISVLTYISGVSKFVKRQLSQVKKILKSSLIAREG